MSSKLLNYPAASSNPHLVSGSGSGAGSTGGGGSSTAGSGRNALAASSSHSAAAAQLNLENLQLDDILCTVCQSVLVEPVFLPCQHRFCRNCLSGTIEKNNLNCPCCRKRFGTWYRNASRVNKLVHEQLWSAIQRQFREYLEEGGDGNGPNGTGGRCNGGSNGTGTVANCFVQQSEIHLSEPGEIRKEYENELQRYRKELIEEKKKELAASEKYIINLYKQEGIIDLVDSSDHLSISSSTSTPEPPVPTVTSSSEKPPQKPAASTATTTTNNTTTENSKTTDDIHEVHDDDEEAGPSGSSFPTSTTGSNPQSKDTATASTTQTAVTATAPRSGTSKSISNGSIISISSTSSASAASSSCISSASSRYSLIKSVAQQIGRGTDIIKQKVQASILNKLTPGGSSSGAAAKKTFTMADLNKSELCVKPTKLHRSWASATGATASTSQTAAAAGDDDDDEDVDDSDSLRSELNHFKPIIATTPKSCFSPKAIVRVPSVRPETGTTLLPSTNKVSLDRSQLSPGKSPFKPIDPTTPRRSAFSVVNVHLFTPPTTATKTVANSGKKAATTPSASSKRKKSAAASKSTGKKKTQSKAAASRRKRKLKFSPQPSAKVKSNAPKPVKQEAEEEAPPVLSRVTRRSFNREADRLKELIINDQQRREAMIEQERRDFEFAQKLQKKLNRTRGAAGVTLAVPEVPKNRYQQHPVQTQQQQQPALVAITTKRNSISAYSLRRKTVMVLAASSTPEPIAGPSVAQQQQEVVSRKRKTMAAQRLPPVPEVPAKQPAQKRKGQPPKAAAAAPQKKPSSTKPSATAEQEAAPPPAKILRRSTRTRH